MGGSQDGLVIKGSSASSPLALEAKGQLPVTKGARMLVFWSYFAHVPVPVTIKFDTPYQIFTSQSTQ